jgi:hypothetical protein
MGNERDLMAALAARVKGITDGTIKASHKVKPIDASLRQAIKASGLTHYAIGKAAEVAPSQIDRFMLPASDPRHRDLRLATAAKIAAVLGMGLFPA